MLYKGQRVMYRDQEMEVIVNEFSGKLALDNDSGQVYVEEIDLTEVTVISEPISLQR